MIFHENRLLADDSHGKSYLFFYRKLGKMSQNVSSAAVVIGALRVNLGCGYSLVVSKCVTMSTHNKRFLEEI